jgi:hypothetical protein
MSLSFSFSFEPQAFARASAAIRERIAVAATLAVRDAGRAAQTAGRADILAAGLGNRFAAALRLKLFPERKASINAAAYLYSKIPYAGVFESGATIRGNPRLWLPTDNVPIRRGGHRMTPQFYARNIGRLISVNVAGRPPMLMGVVPESAVKRAAGGPLKLSRRRRSPGFASRRARFVRVPMFIGLDRVRIEKRLRIADIAARERARLAEYYRRHIG